MKKLVTLLVAVFVGLALEATLGASSMFASLSPGQGAAAVAGLAVVYVLGIAVLYGRHRASRQRAEQRQQSSGWTR